MLDLRLRARIKDAPFGVSVKDARLPLRRRMVNRDRSVPSLQDVDRVHSDLLLSAMSARFLNPIRHPISNPSSHWWVMSTPSSSAGILIPRPAKQLQKVRACSASVSSVGISGPSTHSSTDRSWKSSGSMPVAGVEIASALARV